MVYIALNIKVSISQKKFSSTSLQNFSNFFIENDGFVEKPSITKGLDTCHLIQFVVQFCPNLSNS